MSDLKTTEDMPATLMKVGDKKISFEIHQGSNYKFIDSYQKEYIVDFEQFQRIMKNLVDTEADLITINDKFLSRRFIYLIEPTKELTKKQADEAERKAMEYRRVKDREDELQKIKNNFDVEFFNNKYGVGKWKRYAFGINRGDELILTEKDLKDCLEAFKIKYPSEYQEIEKITKNR